MGHGGGWEKGWGGGVWLLARKPHEEVGGSPVCRACRRQWAKEEEERKFIVLGFFMVLYATWILF